MTQDENPIGQAPEEHRTDAALWRRFRQNAPGLSDGSADDPMLLAAYLDGRLDKDETAAVEAMLVEDVRRGGDLLDTVALSASVAPVAVSPGLARTLAGLRPPAVRASSGRSSVFDTVTGWLRGPQLLRAASVAAMLLATVYVGNTAFELGQEAQTTEADAGATAGSGFAESGFAESGFAESGFDGWSLAESGDGDLGFGDLM